MMSIVQTVYATAVNFDLLANSGLNGDSARRADVPKLGDTLERVSQQAKNKHLHTQSNLFYDANSVGHVVLQ